MSTIRAGHRWAITRLFPLYLVICFHYSPSISLYLPWVFRPWLLLVVDPLLSKLPLQPLRLFACRNSPFLPRLLGCRIYALVWGVHFPRMSYSTIQFYDVVLCPWCPMYYFVSHGARLQNLVIFSCDRCICWRLFILSYGVRTTERGKPTLVFISNVVVGLW